MSDARVLRAVVVVALSCVAGAAWGQVTGIAPPSGPSQGASVFAACPDPASAPTTFSVPCSAILQFKTGISETDRANIVRGAGASLKFNYRTVHAAAVIIPTERAYRILVRHPDVVKLIPDRPVHAFPNNGNGGGNGKHGGGGGGGGNSQVTPSGVRRINAAPGDVAETGAGVGVAIVDTGLDLAHPDLQGNLGPTCYNAFTGGTDCQDDNGHGTHVGGIIAAVDNEVDVVGVAPKATLYAVKVLDSSGSGSDSDVMAGLEWVLTANSGSQPVVPAIRVVNMSLGRTGTPCDNPALCDVITQLHDSGVTVVVAAGNDATADVSEMVPADSVDNGNATVMAIASTTAVAGSNQCRFLGQPISADTASFFTTDGSSQTSTNVDTAGIAISAPGEEEEDVNRGCMIHSTGILSLQLSGTTVRMSGTSMATPHVTGVVALMEQECLGKGGLSPENARVAIQSAPLEVGSAPYDSPTSTYTFDGVREGIVNAQSATANVNCGG